MRQSGGSGVLTGGKYQGVKHNGGATITSRKKAIVRLRNGTTLAVYLPALGLQRLGRVEWLDLEGRTGDAVLAEIRWIAWVRDWNLGEAEPERLLRTSFQARPRLAGLWVRLTFQDGQVLEGLAPAGVELLDDAAQEGGLMLLPPDLRSNTQRLFVPRAALAGFEVVAVIRGGPAKKPAQPARAISGTLFPER